MQLSSNDKNLENAANRVESAICGVSCPSHGHVAHDARSSGRLSVRVVLISKPILFYFSLCCRVVRATCYAPSGCRLSY